MGGFYFFVIGGNGNGIYEVIYKFRGGGSNKGWGGVFSMILNFLVKE